MVVTLAEETVNYDRGNKVVDSLEELRTTSAEARGVSLEPQKIRLALRAPAGLHRVLFSQVR